MTLYVIVDKKKMRTIIFSTAPYTMTQEETYSFYTTYTTDMLSLKTQMREIFLCQGLKWGRP